MSRVVEIKGAIGWHLHLIVDWQTMLHQCSDMTGIQEIIFPISSLILEIDNKGRHGLRCDREYYSMTEEQFNQVMKILSAQKVIIPDSLEKTYPLTPQLMSAPMSGPEDLRDDWPHAITLWVAHTLSRKYTGSLEKWKT